MKRNLNFMLLVLCTLIVSCSNEDTTQGFKTSDLGKTISLQENEVVRVSLATSEIVEIKVLEIGDSRCAADVICIWAGQVEVTFKLPTSNTIKLCLGDQTCTSNSQFEYEGEIFQLQLLDVTPYPSTTNGNEKRSVDFTLVKL